MSATVSTNGGCKTFTLSSVKRDAPRGCNVADVALTYTASCLSELGRNNEESPRYAGCKPDHAAAPEKQKLQRPTNRSSVTEVQQTEIRT